jgi:membrane protease subunit HflC
MTIKRAGAFMTGIILLLLFLAYLTTYTVNFDETAVVTTFGAASEESVKNSSGNHAGIFFRIPWPIQNVIRFDKRISVLEDRLEQQETKDKQVIVLKAFLTWRISEPLKFYRMFRNSERAGVFLLERLRASKAEIGLFTFDDLTNSNPELVRIDDACDALLQRIRRELESHETGIEVLSAGIDRVLLPENITQSVFLRMRQTRQRQAQNARSEGNAIAQSIIAKTDSDKKRMLAFAERMSQRLRAEGDASAARYYKEYSKSPEFAIFLRKLDAFKLSLRENSTFVLDTRSEPFDLLKYSK